MPSANQTRLLKLLGPKYSMKVIDMEDCVYRKLNSTHDIEISGTHRKSRPLSVYVWDISSGEGNSARIVEKVFDLKTDAELLSTLRSIEEKYQS